MRETKISGRVWVIADSTGALIDDIDTDQIYHNQYLAVTNVAEMRRYAFGNLAGWEDFPRKAKAGDIMIVGKNFGAGSSRQHAVDCFTALGIALIIGESFGAIYRRNAINSGLAILECPDPALADLRDGDSIEADLRSGVVVARKGTPLSAQAGLRVEAKRRSRSLGAKARLHGQGFSPVQMDVYQAGDLFKYAKTFEE